MRHLQWRIRLFSAGAGLGLGGIWLESSWLIYGALAALLSGMGLRFLPNEDELTTDETDPSAVPTPPEAPSEPDADG